MLRSARALICVPSVIARVTPSCLMQLTPLVSREAYINGSQRSNNVCIFPKDNYSTNVGMETTNSEAKEMSERDILYKKIVLTIKGHEPQVLKSYESFIVKVCDNLGLSAKIETRYRPVFLRLSLNKSPFIYKKHQRQYEFRTHFKYVTIEKITGCTADVFLEYIQRNLPEGIAMEVARHRLECLPEHLASTNPVTAS